MIPRVEIDLNVRVGGTLTYTGFEDIHGGGWHEMQEGTEVRAFESESGLEGPAVVDHMDYEKGLIYLKVDWPLLSVPI